MIDPEVERRLSALEAKVFGPTLPPLTLGSWKLSLPMLDSDNKIVEVSQPALNAYTGPFFTRTPTNGMRFRVFHGQPTTSGSPNPRCELREMTSAGGLASWSTSKGKHTLMADLQVNRLTRVRPHLVIAQIHDGDDDVTVFRVEGSNLWVTDHDNPHAYLVTSSFVLGRRYRLTFDASGGYVNYSIDGTLLPFRLKVKATGCYFKTGAYLQSNNKTAPGESPLEYAEVECQTLAVSHL